MGTTASEVRARVLAALTGASVAEAAGVAEATWASVLAPRVFDGNRLSGGGRNRGRLPFVETWVESQPFERDDTGSGTVTTIVRLRANVGGADRTTAQALAEQILCACFAALLAEDYFDQGAQSIDTFASQPLWHYLEGTLRVEHTYDPDTFEVD